MHVSINAIIQGREVDIAIQEVKDTDTILENYGTKG